MNKQALYRPDFPPLMTSQAICSYEGHKRSPNELKCLAKDANRQTLHLVDKGIGIV